MGEICFISTALVVYIVMMIKNESLKQVVSNYFIYYNKKKVLFVKIRDIVMNRSGRS
jgi:hypothetical protein